jgi:hypothetical protein
MSETTDAQSDQTTTFAKLWTDSCALLMQTAMSYSPETAPPELLRQIRSGLMQALAQSWQEFLRSPQFLEGMKQMMEQAVAFRQFSAELLTKTRHATEGVAQEDLENLRAAMGQMESRLARQMDALAALTSQLAKDLERVGKEARRPGAAWAAPVRKPNPSSEKPVGKGASGRRNHQN